jgi:hypothetical protein
VVFDQDWPTAGEPSARDERYRCVRWTALVALIVSVHAVEARAGTIVARALDRATHQPLPGGTVMVDGGGLQQPRAGVTDGSGMARIEVPDGVYGVRFYYADRQVRYTSIAVAGRRPRYVVAFIPSPRASIGCWFPVTPPMIEGSSGIEHTFTEQARRRSSPPVGAALGSANEVRVAGFRLPRGAALLPDVLVDEVTVMRAGYDARRGAAAGPLTLIAPRSGTNQWRWRGVARAGQGALEAGGWVAGPLKRDRLWMMAGAAPWSSADARGGAGIARLSLAMSAEHQGEALALATTRETDGERVVTTGGGARWLSKFHHARTELALAAGRFHTAHQRIALPWSDDLRQGQVRVTRRQRAHGHHRLDVGVDAALHTRRHPDPKRAFESRQLAFYAQDSWTPRPNLGIDIGARAELERSRDVRGATSQRALVPRLGAWYDFTREGRSRVFGHWGRYRSPTAPGRAEPITRTIAVAGVEYELLGDLSLALAYEGRGLVGGEGSDGALAILRKRSWDHKLAVYAMGRAGEHDPITGSRYSLRIDGYWALDLCFAEGLWIGAGIRHGLGEDSAVSIGKRWGRLDLRFEVANLDDRPGARVALELFSR